MINKLEFIHFFTAACIVEMVFLYLFRFTRSPLTGKAINNWYSNLGWSAIILDIVSVLIGFYIAKFVYEYFVSKKYITEEYSILKYLAIVLIVQIIHDFSFYFVIIRNSKMGQSIVMDEFKRYTSSVGVGAVIGDSLMYLLGTPLLFYLATIRNDVNIFSSLVSLYLIGYFVHQKPLQ
jgi:hypothetical protein